MSLSKIISPPFSICYHYATHYELLVHLHALQISMSVDTGPLIFLVAKYIIVVLSTVFLDYWTLDSFNFLHILLALCINLLVNPSFMYCIFLLLNLIGNLPLFLLSSLCLHLNNMVQTLSIIWDICSAPLLIAFAIRCNHFVLRTILYFSFFNIAFPIPLCTNFNLVIEPFVISNGNVRLKYVWIYP